MANLLTSDYCTIAEAASKLGITYMAMQRWLYMHQREVRTQKIGRNVLVKLSDVKEARTRHG